MAIVRIGERVAPVRARLAAWIRGSKARFADLHALRRGRMPVLDGQMSLRRQLAFVASVIGGSTCIAGYGLAIVAIVWSHSEPVVRASSSASAAPRQPEVVIAPADPAFDVTRLIGSRDTVIEQIIAERTQAVLDRDRAVAERDAAFAERDAALAGDREMLIDLHARTSRTIADAPSRGSSSPRYRGNISSSTIRVVAIANSFCRAPGVGPDILVRGAKAKAPRHFQVQGLCRELSLAPEKRQQDDDRQGNTDHPKKNTFTKAHVSLLSLNKN